MIIYAFVGDVSVFSTHHVSVEALLAKSSFVLVVGHSS